jgi:hypothetical protein
MQRLRWSDGRGDFVGAAPRAGAALRSPLQGRERRPSPSPVELGIAARFLAPRPKSILSPVQRRNASEVRKGDAETRFRAPTPVLGDAAAKFREGDKGT